MIRLLALLLVCALVLVSVGARPIAFTISSYSIAGWQYGGTTATLKAFANQDFSSSDGQIIKAGNASTGAGFFRTYTCTVSGTTLTIPQITDIPTTTDSPDNPNATITLRFYDYRGTARDYWASGFQFRHTFASPQDWATIWNYNHPPGVPATPPAATVDQVGQMINAALAGAAVFTTGTATLVNGTATVTNTSVTVNSRILVTSQTDGVSGVIRVSGVSAGASFTLTSSNFADNGLVFWSLKP